MSRCLVMVVWKPHEPYDASTTMHIFEGKPDATSLKCSDDFSIDRLFMRMRISLRKTRQVFPYTIVPTTGAKRPKWGDPMNSQYIPWNDEEALRKLNNLVGMPVEVFLADTYQEIPRFHTRVELAN